jgi:Holliday junction resolvasome RuvABC endonuclease subunit
MNVVSVDGSTSNSGVASFKVKRNKDYEYIEHQLFSYERDCGKFKYTSKKKGMSKTAYNEIHKKEKKDQMEKRVVYMINNIREFLNKHKPELIVMEDSYGQNDMMTLKMLSRIQGAVLSWALQHNAQVIFKTPSQWRKEVGIPLVDANKNHLKREQFKELAILIVKQVYGIDVTDDEADAICIGLSMTDMLQ